MSQIGYRPSSINNKEDDFFYFLFDFQHTEILLKTGSTLKRKNLLPVG